MPDSLPYIVVIIFSIIRFDVGWDYDGMARLFKVYANSDSFSHYSKEPTFFYLCKLFSFYSKGYVIILALYFIATIYFLRECIRYYKIKYEGLFVFIALCLMFDSYDRVRQSLAIFIFIYALRFIDREQFGKYILVLLLAILFHYSAILLIPYYWFLRIPFSRLTRILIFTLAWLLFFIGVWTSIRYKLFSMIPFYGDIYANKPQFLLSVSTNTGLGVIFTIITLFLPLIILPNTKDNTVILNGIFFGAILYFIASGNLLMERFTQYFTFINFVGLSLVCKNKMNNRFIIGLTLFFWFQASIYINRSGSNPYTTIFSKEFQNQVFRKSIQVDLKDE
jgi:hypothetical protein